MTNDTVHVVVKDGYPVAVTPDHDVADAVDMGAEV